MRRACQASSVATVSGPAGAAATASDTAARLSATHDDGPMISGSTSAAATSSMGARTSSTAELATPSLRSSRRASGSHAAGRRSRARATAAMARSVARASAAVSSISSSAMRGGTVARTRRPSQVVPTRAKGSGEGSRRAINQV